MSNYQIDFKKLLQGRYEAEHLPKDFTPERDVPDFAFNVLNQMGLLYYPVVDDNHLTTGGSKPIWPYGKSFAVCLTHDVDIVSLYSFPQSARMRGHQLIKGDSTVVKTRGLMGLVWDTSQLLRHATAQDPLHCYERWLEFEKKVSAHSTFFFWPGWKTVSCHHHSDCPYNLEDQIIFDRQQCTVAEMIREIDHRGWEIGLHPSWYSFNNVDEMKRQKEVLEKTVGHDIVSVRQHFLHYDIRVTPRVQSDSGFKYDSTLGFNDNIGFRFGTCYPWKLYDLKAEEELPLTEVPLIIQDGALLNPAKGMRLDEETAFKYIKHTSEAVKQVGGVLTLLWHPNNIINPPLWNLYQRTLLYLKEQDAWFGTVQEVVEKMEILAY